MQNRMVLVTGGCGFLGSNIVRKLNQKNQHQVIIVDNYDEQKLKNLKHLSFTDYLSYKQGIPALRKSLANYDLASIIHIGANADVLVKDPDIMMEANYEHSKFYLEESIERGIPIIYGSSSAVYGNSVRVSGNAEEPHNMYAWSKWMFDKYVSAHLPAFTNKVIGLRFFNIFGMGEFHKGKNASLPLRFFSFLQEKGFIDVFDREIQRDYVWVEDVADIILSLLDTSDVSNGIYDLGGNNPLSHKKIASIVAEAYVEKGLRPDMNGLIKNIPMPPELVHSFQFYTKAHDLLPLIAKQTIDNESKIRNYIHELIKSAYGIS